MTDDELKKSAYKFLHTAIEDLEAARRMLVERPELLKARVMHDETLLHFMAVENQLDVVKMLIEFGIDVNEPNCFGGTALSDAVQLDHYDMAMLLLDHGAHPDANCPYGCLWPVAAQNSNLRLMEALLQRGANVRIEEGEGSLWTQIEWMEGVLQKHKVPCPVKRRKIRREKENWKYLSAAGHACPSRLSVEDRGRDPEGIVSRANLLLEDHSRKQEFPAGLRSEADEFIDALLVDPPRARRMLQDKKNLIEARSSAGVSVLIHVAVSLRSGAARALRMLLQAGANPDAKDDKGDTALVLVTQLDQFDRVKPLLEFGADPDAISSKHFNALHCAMKQLSAPIADYLLAAGARHDYVADDGESIWSHLFAIEEILLKYNVPRPKPVPFDDWWDR